MKYTTKKSIREALERGEVLCEHEDGTGDTIYLDDEHEDGPFVYHCCKTNTTLRMDRTWEMEWYSAPEKRLWKEYFKKTVPGQ